MRLESALRRLAMVERSINDLEILRNGTQERILWNIAKQIRSNFTHLGLVIPSVPEELIILSLELEDPRFAIFSSAQKALAQKDKAGTKAGACYEKNCCFSLHFSACLFF